MNGNYYSKWIKYTTFKHPHFILWSQLFMWTFSLFAWMCLLLMHQTVILGIFFIIFSLIELPHWGRLAISKWFYDRNIDNYCDKE